MYSQESYTNGRLFRQVFAKVFDVLSEFLPYLFARQPGFVQRIAMHAVFVLRVGSRPIAHALRGAC